MSKYKLKQKVTIKDGFYAPVNGVITRVKTGIAKNDLSTSFGINDYIQRCDYYERYNVSYEQHGFMNRIITKKDMVDGEFETGWHGMKCNGDAKEFEKFGVKVPGFNK